MILPECVYLLLLFSCCSISPFISMVHVGKRQHLSAFVFFYVAHFSLLTLVTSSNSPFFDCIFPNNQVVLSDAAAIDNYENFTIGMCMDITKNYYDSIVKPDMWLIGKTSYNGTHTIVTWPNGSTVTTIEEAADVCASFCESLVVTGGHTGFSVSNPTWGNTCHCHFDSGKLSKPSSGAYVNQMIHPGYGTINNTDTFGFMYGYTACFKYKVNNGRHASLGGSFS